MMATGARQQIGGAYPNIRQEHDCSTCSVSGSSPDSVSAVGLVPRPPSCHFIKAGPSIPAFATPSRFNSGGSDLTMKPKYTRDGDKNRSGNQPRSFLVGDTVLVLPPEGDGEDRGGDGEPRTRWWE